MVTVSDDKGVFIQADGSVLECSFQSVSSLLSLVFF